jgi:hypothetical protein
MAVSLICREHFFVTDQTPCPYPTRSIPSQLPKLTTLYINVFFLLKNVSVLSSPVRGPAHDRVSAHHSLLNRKRRLLVWTDAGLLPYRKVRSCLAHRTMTGAKKLVLSPHATLSWHWIDKVAKKSWGSRCSSPVEQWENKRNPGYAPQSGRCKNSVPKFLGRQVSCSSETSQWK